MNKQDIDKLYFEASDSLIELSLVSTNKGLHLDNDLEGGLFGLLLEENYREMKLFKARIEHAISQIKNETFKIKDIENILSHKDVA